MKRCVYCGKEYPDDLKRCLVDNELLVGDAGQFEETPKEENSVEQITFDATARPQAEVLPLSGADRKLRFIEVALVCAIAFGGSLLASAWVLFFGDSGQTSESSATLRWMYSGLQEVSALVLVWYFLKLRNKSFLDLGFYRRLKDVGWSIGLLVAGSMAFYTVYAAIYLTGLATNHNAASAQVADSIFGGGISGVTILFMFLNPFFEELIVRAYLMTEIKHLTKSSALAIAVSTGLQASYHLYQGVPLAIATGAMFLIFSIYYSKTNRIFPIILAHLYCDVGSTLWYVLGR
jgi:membrane protease YdiL (CAAX protease family)